MVFRRTGCALSMQAKSYGHAFFTLEILDFAHFIQSLLQPNKEYYVKHKMLVAMFEMDVERMSPNVKGVDVHKAVGQ